MGAPLPKPTAHSLPAPPPPPPQVTLPGLAEPVWLHRSQLQPSANDKLRGFVTKLRE